MARILIVEPDPLAARALVLRLNSLAHDTEVAKDVDSAVLEISIAKPEVLLTDISQPGTDGLGLVRQLLAAPLTQGMPILFVTANRDPAFRDQARKLGAVAFLDKPFSAETLAAAIMQVQQSRAQRKQPASPK